MKSAIIIVFSIFWIIYFQCADCAVVYQCYWFFPSRWTFLIENNAVTNNWCEEICKADGTNYQYSGTISEKCFCRETKPDWISDTSIYAQCTEKKQCPGDPFEFCGGFKRVDTIKTERITVSKIERSVETVTVKTPTHATTANVEWSLWNDWTFCEVNCVREDTTEGKKRRWRTCNGSNCSGDTMEERSCLRPGICKGMRPRKLLCKCPKRLINTKWHNLDGKNITDAEVKKIVLEDFNKNIKSEMSVDKKTVSKEVRKKNSSVNKGKSAQSIGWGCIVFLVLPVVFLIAIDLLNCCISFRTRLDDRRRNQISPTPNTQDQINSSKPLQENVNATESYYGIRCGNNCHPDEMKRETYQRTRDDNNQPGRDEWLQYI